MEPQKTLETHFAFNLSADNKFYLDRAFKGLYYLPCDSSKVVYIINEYLNMYCVIVSLGNHLELEQTLKRHFALNTSAYNKLYLNRAFKGFYWLRCDSSKVFFILNEYLNIHCVIICVRDSFRAQTNLEKSLCGKTNSF